MVRDVAKSIKKLKNYKYILFTVFILSVFLRFWGLGYSEFYGDETKTFYLDKTTPAHEFFLNQRKGPVQFAVVWFMEKVVGGYDEFYTRIPFALAGILAVPMLFFIVQKIAGNKAALIATTLFGLNGFYIAFSRTVQYQSFMILFGFLAIYFALLYQETANKTRLHYAMLSALFLALSYLSHYDAVFFDVVISFILIKIIYDRKDEFWAAVKEVVIYFIIPTTIIAALFYVPYVLRGYYQGNTLNYMSRRLSGLEYGKNASWYTFWVYNPHSIWAFLSVFIIPYLLKRAEWGRNLLFFWFLVPFIAFQFIFSNPGTHIHNYFIPLIVIVSVGIADFMEMIEDKKQKQYLYAFLLYIFGLLLVVDLFVFVPAVNKGYPWKDSSRLNTHVSKINKDFHLFLYGFPYKRGWAEIANYVYENGIREIYTNDNDTIAKYYVRGVSYKKPGPNFLPKHFIYVYDNQEFVDIPADMRLELDNRTLEDVYSVEHEFYVNGEVSAVLFKRSY